MVNDNVRVSNCFYGEGERLYSKGQRLIKR